MTASAPFHHSGQSGQAWLLPIIGLLSAAVAAFVYAWIDVYSPIGGYVSVLFVMGLAAGAALPLAFAGQWLKVRSVYKMRVAGIVTGLLTIYLAWAFFAWVLCLKSNLQDAPTLWQWTESPARIWSFASLLNEEGWYTIGHNLTPSGILLWVLWAAEAAIVLGACFWLAPSRIQARGYCEDCNTWMVDEETLSVPAQDDALPRAVREQGLASIVQIEADQRAGKWLHIHRQRCPQCRAAAVYRIDHARVVQTKKGKRTESRPLLPLSWQTAAEQAELERIAALLR